MFTLIKDGTLYAPEKIGKKDILIVGKTIARISDRIDLPESFDVQTVSASGKIVAPGMIDLHVQGLPIFLAQSFQDLLGRLISLGTGCQLTDELVGNLVDHTSLFALRGEGDLVLLG